VRAQNLEILLLPMDLGSEVDVLRAIEVVLSLDSDTWEIADGRVRLIALSCGKTVPFAKWINRQR